MCGCGAVVGVGEQEVKNMCDTCDPGVLRYSEDGNGLSRLYAKIPRSVPLTEM